MIHIKTEKELEKMRVAGRLTAIARKAAADAVKPGVTTWEIDRIVRKTIEDAGAKPSFLGYGGFPGSACVSLNDQVIHGIPSKHAVVKEGDIVKVDVGAYIGGFHGDCACTVPCGEVSEEAKKLIAVTRQSFFEGIKFAREGYRVSDIGAAVQAYVEANGFSVVRDYVGHGVGAALHESPEVPNYGKPGHGIRLQRGMVIAVEPMVNVEPPRKSTIPMTIIPPKAITKNHTVKVSSPLRRTTWMQMESIFLTSRKLRYPRRGSSRY